MVVNSKSAGFPAITLKNGLTVVNYSSPHTYTFSTGEVLAACDLDLVKKHSLTEKHEEFSKVVGDKEWVDVRIVDELNDLQLDSLRMINHDPDVDIVLVPLRVMTALKRTLGKTEVRRCKYRVCRIEDRITKVLYPNKFCI